jgi:hypothetical protein
LFVVVVKIKSMPRHMTSQMPPDVVTLSDGLQDSVGGFVAIDFK